MDDRCKSKLGSVMKAGVLFLAACTVVLPALAQDPILDAYSREVVVVNSAGPSAYTDTQSRESVLVNSEPAPMLTQANSMAATVVNSETPGISFATSREAVLVASEIPVITTQSYSKEAVAVVSESPIVDTFSREIAIYDGYYVAEAFDALRIAGGIQAATTANTNRFALALQLTNATRINLPVAVRILRMATRLQP